jgi:16S rRNA (adenine1518-N6/adenine1519-N6)-dimethyltransferase
MPSYLWQNFLKDSTYTIFIAQKVGKICDDLKLEQCIEIGPGKWALTKKLIAIVDRPLVLLEKDETLVPHLQQFLDAPWNHKIDLIMGDALALDTASLLEQKWWNPNQTVVVGNLPYYITSPLITKFFGWWNAVFPAGVFMVQKEVADKIRWDAEKKSFLWWLLNYQYEVKHLKTVPAKAFSPAPKVQSAIFSLIEKNEKPQFSYTEMIWVLDQISKYKRKTLGKCRKMATPELAKKYPLPEDLSGKRLEEIGLEEMGTIITNS